MGTRRKYTDEFTVQAIRLASQHETLTSRIADNLGIILNMLGSWVMMAIGVSGRRK